MMRMDRDDGEGEDKNGSQDEDGEEYENEDEAEAEDEDEEGEDEKRMRSYVSSEGLGSPPRPCRPGTSSEWCTKFSRYCMPQPSVSEAPTYITPPSPS